MRRQPRPDLRPHRHPRNPPRPATDTRQHPEDRRHEQRNEANIGELINMALEKIEDTNRAKLEGA
jgi:hypothetical protein